MSSKIIYFVLYPILKRLGYEKKGQLNLQLPESHFYQKDNLYKAFTSIHYQYLRNTGWIESKKHNRPIKNGKYIPWITYGALHFLQQFNISKWNIVEIGSGASTFYFKDQVKSLISYEFDDEYLSAMKKIAGNNVQFKSLSDNKYSQSGLSQLPDELLKVLEFEIQNGNFDLDLLNNRNIPYFIEDLKEDINQCDLLFIDGGPRVLISYLATLKAKSNCLVILDNTETEYGKVCSSYFKTANYINIPFRGLGPLNPNETETTFLFKDTVTLQIIK